MIIIYVPCPSYEEAHKISCFLVKNKLCESTTIFKDSQLIYTWPVTSTKLEEENIALMSIKASKKQYKDIETIVKEMHSYDAPCFYAVPIITINC